MPSACNTLTVRVVCAGVIGRTDGHVPCHGSRSLELSAACARCLSAEPSACCVSRGLTECVLCQPQPALCSLMAYSMITTDNTGFAEVRAWISLLEGSDVDSVLRSRGIILPEHDPASANTVADAAPPNQSEVLPEAGASSIVAEVTPENVSLPPAAPAQTQQLVAAQVSGLPSTQAPINLSAPGVPSLGAQSTTGSELLTEGFSVQKISDTIAALLDYNDLAHQDGFEAFDVDEDDRINMEDLLAAAESLQLDANAEDLSLWFRAVNVSGDGRITFQEWNAALGSANSEEVLRSRGVAIVDADGVQISAGSQTGAIAPSSVVPTVELPNMRAPSVGKSVADVKQSPGEAADAIQNVTDTIAAILKHSELSIDDGFAEFDCDQDGSISSQDLSTSCQQLELDVSMDHVRLWYQSVDASAAGISLETWRAVLSGANADRVLRSRGVVLESESGAQASSTTKTGNSLPVAMISNMLAATLAFNELPFHDAFQDFDEDADGKISQADFESAASQLQLDDTSLADLTAWHRHYNTAGDGYMTMDEWLAALNAADVEKTLRSRGVDASTISGGSGKDMELIHRVAGSFNAVFRVRNSFPLQNTCYADPSPGRSQVHVCCEPADDH